MQNNVIFKYESCHLMKKYPFLIYTPVLLILLLFFASCTPHIDPEQELIRNYMPDSRETCQKYGKYGEYSYNLYAHGIELHALSPELSATYVEVWDVNHDGTFDSVWSLDHGKWRFWSNQKHQILVNDPDPSFSTGLIGLAHIIRNLENGVPKGLPPSQLDG